MYAVGKVGSFISRSVYTVSGPFHPFGGAVDIVVVQQQDGSFKSSPWYVRFGKFQGVLKTREKVVNIAVNGEEAGFHMYLDSNGEAFFLRNGDPNLEEGDFVVSPVSSDDEREVPVQDAQLRKSKSISCDNSTMETDVTDGKILTRTSSRRTTILERMFGRKSVKDNAHAVDRVSSLERAEIAAELLDTNWSTNPSRAPRTRRSNDEPSKSNLADAGNGNLVETSKIVLPVGSFDHEKAMGSNCDSVDSNFCSPRGGTNSSEDENDHYVQMTSVKEEVVEIYTHDSGGLTDGITSITEQPGSKSMSNDLGTDKIINESVNIQSEMLGNFEDDAGREMNTKEVLSHDIFEIHAIEADITKGKSEVFSQLVTTDSDGAHQNFIDANSPIHGTTCLSSEKHGVSLIASAQDACEEKVVIISSSETLESSYDASGILADKVCDDAVGIPMADGVQLEERSRLSTEKIEHVIFEDKPLSYYGASSNKEDTSNLDIQGKEIFVLGDSSSQISQANCPDKDISADTVVDDHVMHSTHGSDIEISMDAVANDHSTHTCHDLASQHDLVFPDASSSVVEISNYVPENDPGDVTTESNVENKTCNGDLDIPVIHISTTGEETRECTSQSANSPDKVQPEGPQFFSDFSSLGKLEAENTKQEDDENRSSSASGVEIEIVPEATYEPKEEAEAVVSFSVFVEGIQFQFSDTESFADRNTIDDVIANKAACAGEHDEFDCDVEQQGRYDTGLENNLENHSDSSRLETSPVPFPGSELHSGDDNLEAKSLPNIRSHIHDLERSDCVQLSRSLQSNGENNGLENIVPIPGSELHSGDNNLEAKSLPNLRPHIHDLERSDCVQLSCSPQSNGENNGVDPVKTTNSVFPEQEPEWPDDSEENCGPPELTNNVLLDDLKVDSFNPFAELSLCRHLLSEGMGADAACKAFDAKKITLEKFRAMKQSLIRDNKLVVRIAGHYFPWDAAAPVVLGMVSFREEQVFESQGMIKVERVEPGGEPSGSWRIWPFSSKRTRSVSTVQPVCESTVESSFSTPVKESDRENTKPRAKRMERKVRSLTPTSEELASLHLREGKNVVTFTFSTGMLGKQQVDAHIYLWKWNTRIVISDVDGTITKSDVLGQFMPLVGVDWSQNGVAHLFSAIKENGYQLLFLSARSISQAHLTRQFLFNLKQDGKALPDGPVVISPDGLFPSLYREVIRRAPHEFKISCLEAIKELFPPDSRPFYAGFGNRDTDELSYLKVGVPMGKIFIINPKGEVAVNRRVDTKSYTSLHALVNGMFPPISSSSEQEDYNTWNYWKMPLPSVDI